MCCEINFNLIFAFVLNIKTKKNLKKYMLEVLLKVFFEICLLSKF